MDISKTYTISVFSEDHAGLLNRVALIFSRRKLNIKSITASESELSGIHRFTIVLDAIEEVVIKVVKQLEKIIEVFKAFYYAEGEVVHQEIALYKLPTSSLVRAKNLELVIRKYAGRILTVEPDFLIIEKIGHKEETQELLRALQPFGVCEFARSGRVVISKPMKELKVYLQEMGAVS